LNIEEAHVHKFRLIKISETIGMIFNDKIYELTKQFVDKYAIEVQFYSDQKQTGVNNSKTEFREFTSMLKEICAVIRREIN